MFTFKIKFHYLPESLAIVFLGAVVGMFMMALPEVKYYYYLTIYPLKQILRILSNV